jgi:type II restriction/modification system DNA methylase subunit YeeA
MAWSDRDWILDGANVHVSIVGFDDGSQEERRLDGQSVGIIHSNLTSGTNTPSAVSLTENAGICFMGPSAKGSFDIDERTAAEMLNAPSNINNRPNSDVVRPVASGIDLVKRSREVWTIDFGTSMTEADAALYEMPFEYVKRHVYPERLLNNRESYRSKWWLYGEPRPAMRAALAPLRRFIATPAVSKHRMFVWKEPRILCNQGTLVFAREDHYFFGVLHSRIHEVWARSQGTQVREAESGFRYTPTSTFETFPFPWPPCKEPVEDPRVKAIAEAAKELVEKRDAWLNPPGTSEKECADRTLTNLYNKRPAWLIDAHRKLDEAVFAAYGWPATLTDSEILERLLALNHERSSKDGPKSN